MSAAVKPFEFEVVDDRDPKTARCAGDACMYKAEFRTWTETAYPDYSSWGGRNADSEGLFLYLCRTCLRRMRATLKEAEKQLPKRDSARPITD